MFGIGCSMEKTKQQEAKVEELNKTVHFERYGHSSSLFA